jgi:hypothetical protein
MQLLSAPSGHARRLAMLLWHAPSRPKTKPKPQPRSVTPLHSAPAMPWHGLPRSVQLLLLPSRRSLLVRHLEVRRCLICAQPCFTTKLWLSSNSTLRPLRLATSRTTSPPSSTLIQQNFSRWYDQFLLILGKFSLQDHVREDPPDPISPDWARMDCVKSWIIAKLTDDLGEIISARGSTTRHAWLAIES